MDDLVNQSRQDARRQPEGTFSGSGRGRGDRHDADAGTRGDCLETPAAATTSWRQPSSALPSPGLPCRAGHDRPTLATMPLGPQRREAATDRR